MNIVYVAGGLNSRFEELSIFPKILLPFRGNTSILEHNYNVFKNHKQHLIINTQYYKMVKNFIEVNNLDINIIESTNTNGSYNTIASVKDQLPEGGLLFIWSDLIFEEDFIGDNIPIHSCMIYTYSNNYRFHACDNIITKVEHGGNVPGIYYLDKKLIANTSVIVLDLIEYIDDQSIPFFTYEIDQGIFEFRDKQIYLSYIAQLPPRKRNTRHFNSLEINDDVVIKKVAKEQYYNLIVREYNWYQEIKESNITPKLLDVTYFDHMSCVINGFKLDYLKEYVTLYQYWKDHADDRLTQDAALKKVEDTMYRLWMYRKKIPLNTVLNDLTKEFYNKVLDRTESVKDMIFNYDKDYLEAHLCDALTKIINYFISNAEGGYIWYHLIHGDLNGSNILIHPITLDVKFIDPRGYFGDTELYGPRLYDMAKLNYFLYGYDHFNLGNYMYAENKFAKPPIYRHNKYQSNIISIMTAIIYISLTSYICDNVMKVNIAYEHGLKLLQNALLGYPI